MFAVGAVAKFLWYSADLELSLAAVRVLARLCESPRARPHLVCEQSARLHLRQTSYTFRGKLQRQKIDETAAVRQTATEGVVLRLEARKVDVCAWLPSAAHRPGMAAGVVDVLLVPQLAHIPICCRH